MFPMDAAWAFLKAPVYDTGIPGIKFVTQGDEDWTQDKNLHGGLPGAFIAEGASFGPEEREIPHEAELERDAEVVHMTPNDFLQETGTDDMGNYEHYVNLMRRAMGGEDMRFVMPRADWEFTDSPVGHDGRHRMAALAALGHGTTPVPVYRNF